MYCDEYASCHNTTAIDAKKFPDKVKWFFLTESPAFCGGFSSKIKPGLAEQRNCLEQDGAKMLTGIYRDRAQTRATLANNPNLIQDDCPDYLYPTIRDLRTAARGT